MYIPARGAWFEYYEHAWHADRLHGVVQKAIDVTRDILLDSAKLAIEAAQARDKSMRAQLSAEAEELLGHARKSQQKPRLDAMISLSSTDPRLAIDQATLDSNDMAIGLQNGALELGDVTTFRPGLPGDYITRQAGTAWLGGQEDVTCTAWESFLSKVQPDPDVRHWLQKFAGYCLTGATSEQLFVIFQGTGANGKSVFIDVIKKMLGTYAQTVQFSTFVETDQNAIRNDLAALDKARLVVASEGPEGARLDEGIIKQVTGEDEITARFLHREFFTYKPKFKVILVTNHKPVISGTDNGIWRRVVLVPFPIVIKRENQDKQLSAKLERELPGILAWAVAGFHLWREQGLGDLPRALTAANGDYRRDSDVIGTWVEDCCDLDNTNSFSSASDLYRSYSTWAVEMGHRPMSSKSLGDRLRERGLTQSKRKGERGWAGIIVVRRPIT
jgi:putative DNA primase/helicase